MNWLNIIAVFVGSGLGGVCRYVVGRAIQSHLPESTLFPWGTFAVNITGCLLIGLLYGLIDRNAPALLLSPHTKLLLTVGFCGGFTTFSTFINENYLLFQSPHLLMSLGYMAASITAGFAMLYAGYSIAQLH